MGVLGWFRCIPGVSTPGYRASAPYKGLKKRLLGKAEDLKSAAALRRAKIENTKSGVALRRFLKGSCYAQNDGLL